MIALLLPTVAAMREQGRRIQCFNNLCQHSVENIPGHGGKGFVPGAMPVMVLFVDGYVGEPFYTTKILVTIGKTIPKKYTWI